MHQPSPDKMKLALHRRRGKSLEETPAPHMKSDLSPELEQGDSLDEENDRHDLGLAPEVHDVNEHLDAAPVPHPRNAVNGDKMAVDEELGDPSDHQSPDGEHQDAEVAGKNKLMHTIASLLGKGKASGKGIRAKAYAGAMGTASRPAQHDEKV